MKHHKIKQKGGATDFTMFIPPQFKQLPIFGPIVTQFSNTIKTMQDNVIASAAGHSASASSGKQSGGGEKLVKKRKSIRHKSNIRNKSHISNKSRFRQTLKKRSM